MADRTTARERLPKAASDLFHSEGTVATGIDAITARAGVASISLGDNFASRAELAQAYIQARHGEWRRIRRTRSRTAATSRDHIRAVCDTRVDHAAVDHRQGFRGCGPCNAASERPMAGIAQEPDPMSVPSSRRPAHAP